MDARDATPGWPAEDAEPATYSREEPRHAGSFSHVALFYSAEQEGFGAVDAIADEASAAAPIHVAMTGKPLARLRDALRFEKAGEPGTAGRTLLADMAELGRNPARVIPAARSFAARHPGEHVYCLWEPAWPGRSAAELREVARHEALCNLAFSGTPMSVMCLYDRTSLGPEVIGYAERTHPFVYVNEQRRDNPAYLGAGRFPEGCDDPLPPPPAADTLDFNGRLDDVRGFAARHARSAALSAERATDVVIAVSELAGNAYRYAGGGGTIRAWCTEDELLCQIEDTGHIKDPLAGCNRQPLGSATGHGLWLVNQVTDLVERRTGPGGTTTRLHMWRRLPAAVMINK